MKELIKPYLKDYLYGKTEGSHIAILLNMSINIVNRYLNELTQELIDDYQVKPLEVAVEDNVNVLINLYEVGEFKDNDFTIKDWVIMTEAQREPYLVTELNY